MSWTLHHVNLEARDVRATAQFYATMLGMKENAWTFPETRGYLPGSPDRLALFGDGRQSHTGLHLIAPDPDFPARNNLTHNPSVGGHPAFQVPDLDAVMRRLDAAGIRYSYTPEFAIPGFHHLYLEDPSGNLIEVNARI